MKPEELEKKLKSLLPAAAGNEVLDLSKKLTDLGEPVALAAESAKGKEATLFAIVHSEDADGRGQILVRLSQSRAGGAKGSQSGWTAPKELHRDTVVFPLPMADKPEDEVPEDIAQELAVACAKRLTSRKLTDDEADTIEAEVLEYAHGKDARFGGGDKEA